MRSRVPRPSNRRRIDRIGGGVLAVLGLVVAVVAVVALRHPNGRQARPVALRTTSTTTITATAPTPTPSTSPSASATSTVSTSTSASAHSVPLVVLNSTSIQGLADTASQRFESAGWTVTWSGNLTNDILSTCAYYDPSDPANEAAAQQLQQQFPEIKRVKERFAELPPGPIIVVLTTDYS
jgi:hypothetical protein